MSATVVTFYSFKGGVGRTQALANIAVGLANRGRNVAMVDMDLESPGLHTFFHPEDRGRGPFPFRDEDFIERRGLIDFIEACAQKPKEEPRIHELLVPCAHPNLKPSMGWIRLLPAGRLTDDYPARIGAFSWEHFYTALDGYRFMEFLRDRLVQSGADYVLVDSRTGMTDIANICTFQLPDVVVVLFALHEQGVEGAWRAARAIAQARSAAGDTARARRVVLVPSRVEEGGDSVRRDDWILRARTRLVDTGTLLIDLGQRLPYAAEFAYGETVVIDAGEPSNLARAYERLLDEIVGAPRSPSVPAPRRPSFKELRADIDRLGQNVHALVQELDTTSLRELPLLQFRRFAHEVLRKRNGLVDEARKLRERLNRLAAESGMMPEQMPEVDIEALETTNEWTAIVRDLRQALDAHVASWIATEQQRIKLRLLDVADQDAFLIAGALDALRPWIECGETLEIEARLPAIEEDIAHSGLDALLRRDALDRGRLARSRPDEALQVAWLDERLARVISEGSFDSDLVRMLSNLLRLRAEMPGPPTSLHWSAYEVLGARVQGDANEAVSVFVSVGHWLWLTAWDEILTSPERSESLRGLAGPEAHKNLEIALRTRPEVGAWLVQRIGDGLLRLWSEGKRRVVQEIVTRRRGDSGLRVALEAFGSTTAPRARREILAAWLRGGEVTERDTSTVQGYLEALVEEGYEAEAFYALEAFRETGVAAGLDGASVYLAILLRALERSREALVEALIVDKEIRDRIASLRAGKALFLLLAWLPGRFSENVRRLGSLVRSSLVNVDASGAMLPPELLALTEEPIEFEISSAREVRACESAIRSEFQSNRFRGNWDSSRLYEADFYALIAERLDRLLRSIAPRDQEIERQQGIWDAEAWIEASFAGQRGKGLRTSNPEGAARKNIISTFTEAQERFLKLAHLRPPTGVPSLSMLLNAERGMVERGRALHDWLLVTPSLGRLERRLAGRVVRLLSASEDEER